MNELDVSPMIAALRSHPEQFEEFAPHHLFHLPSRHDFYFHSGNKASVSAHCGCSSLNISPEQQEAISNAFRQWHNSYWRTIVINREFASHFSPPSLFRGMLIKLVGATYRRLIAGREPHYRQDIDRELERI